MLEVPLKPGKRIQVIVNPAAGPAKPILGTFNHIFREAGIEWELLITKEAGDARRLAHEAAAEADADGEILGCTPCG
jgi:diacylglycerol kinase family enzyme